MPLVFNVGDGKLQDIVCRNGCEIKQGSELFWILSKAYDEMVEHDVRLGHIQRDFERSIAMIYEDIADLLLKERGIR
jgi:hypothetical protein